MLLPRLLRSSSSLQASLCWTESLPKCLLKRQWQRFYSIQTDASSLARLPNIDPSKLSITETTTPKELVPPEELVFGRTFTGESRESPSISVLTKLIHFPVQIICCQLNGQHHKDGLRLASHPTKTSASTQQPAYSTTPLKPLKA